MNRFASVVLVVITTMFSFATATLAQKSAVIPGGGSSYTAIMLDDSFRSTGDICKAVAISNNEIVVNTEREAEWPPAPRWAVVVRMNGMLNSGPYVARKLAPVAGFTHSFAWGINSSGYVVGMSTRWSPNLADVATVWDPNGNPIAIESAAEAFAISNTGKVAVFREWWGATPFVYDLNTGARTYLQMGQYQYGQPIAINDGGVVTGIVAYGGPQLAYQPCAWNPDGTMAYLGNFAGQINAINSVGTSVGAVYSHGFMPCMWAYGQCSLLPLPSDAVSGMANGINNMGAAVGYADIGYTRKGVLWQNNRPTVLPQPGSLRQWDCAAISPRSIIVGSAYDGWNDNTRAVAWVPLFWGANPISTPQ